MSSDLQYSRIYFCHTCRKYLDETGFKAHIALGHKTDSYISMPNIIKNTPKTRIESDLAEVYEDD